VTCVRCLFDCAVNYRVAALLMWAYTKPSFLFLPKVAKIFLDPLDNDDFTRNSIDMDLGVLIREANAGSTHWKKASAKLPFALSPPGRKQR